MSTAGSIIKRAYQMIGYLASNEPMSGADEDLGLDQFNKMIDLMSNETLACFAITEQNVVLTPGKSFYSIGQVGTPDINLVRPIRIMEGAGSAYLQDSNSNNYSLDVITQDRWNQIANRSSTITSDIPDTLFYDPQFPLGIINIWPTPTQAFKLFFDSYLQLANLANVSTSLSLPPGYELMFQSNLAVLLGPFCKGALVSEDVKAIARTSKADVKRSNKRNTTAQFDAEIVSSGRPTYNIYSGRYR